MKQYLRYIIIIAPGLVMFAIKALHYMFPYLLKEHALIVDSPYFLIACVVCGTMPLTVALLFVVYKHLQQIKERKDVEENELF